jgi:ABC-type dipeptide/oligopeptide/nickel transport system ATPase subunit
VIDGVDPAPMDAPVLQIRNLDVSFRGNKRLRRSVLRNISFAVSYGETLAVVGPSGCGKTTLARAVVGLVRIDSGSVRLVDQELVPGSRGRRLVAAHCQLVFQDPNGSLNPRQRLAAAIEEPLCLKGGIGRKERRARVLDAASSVGLDAKVLERFPHALSGGQRQRAAIARALVAEPQVLILDEPTSALDLAVQAQILNLLIAIMGSRRLGTLLITHDMGVVRHLADRVLVLDAGRVEESGAVDELFARPQSSVTRRLIAASRRELT